MKDILIGFIIILVIALGIDFIYSEKNSCLVTDEYGTQDVKCGFLKKEMNIDFKLLDRYW